jgi:hypothetical protein
VGKPGDRRDPTGAQEENRAHIRLGERVHIIEQPPAGQPSPEVLQRNADLVVEILEAVPGG